MTAPGWFAEIPSSDLMFPDINLFPDTDIFPSHAFAGDGAPGLDIFPDLDIYPS